MIWRREWDSKSQYGIEPVLLECPLVYSAVMFEHSRHGERSSCILAG